MTGTQADWREEGPIWDRRFRFPANFPLVDGRVHVAFPAYETPSVFRASQPLTVYDGRHVFIGTYYCCLGQLTSFMWHEWRDADFRDWIVDAPITCVTCLNWDTKGHPCRPR